MIKKAYVNGCRVIGIIDDSGELGRLVVLDRGKERPFGRYVVARHREGDTEWSWGYYTDDKQAAFDNMMNRYSGRS